MASQMRPYIGVTGVTTVGEASAVQAAFARRALSTHELRLGIALRESTLFDDADSGRYVSGSRAAALVRVCRGRDIVHYNSEEHRPLNTQLRYLLDRVAPTALQVNAPYNLDTLAALCVPRGVAVGVPGIPPFRPTLGTMDFVLIDESGGQGKPLSVERALAAHHRLAQVTSATVVFAGGLSGRTVGDVVRRLRDAIGDAFGLDAESRLRVRDHLSLPAVDEYFAAIEGALSR